MRKRLEKAFANFASKIAELAGSPYAFAAASLFILAWAAFGSVTDFSQNWQLIVNTATTICTFLMVFVIQNSQNRDGLALQIKLDELIRAMGAAKNDMIDLESLSADELKQLRTVFAKLGSSARNQETPPNTARQPKPRSAPKAKPGKQLGRPA
jgi:low affinity Fe/Cu permease